MKFFRDTNGRQWQLSVTVGAMKRVQALCGVNLYQIIELDNSKTSLLDRLASDPILLVDVLYAVCKPQADQIHVSDSDFGEAMTGQTIDDASDALLQEIVDFFPEAKRQAMTRVLSAARRFRTAQEKHLMDLVQDPDFDRKIDSALQKLNPSSGSSQASSASTPIP